MLRKEIEERLVLAGVVGSTGYGLARPESDIDVKGICIASRPYYLGFKNFEVRDHGWDTDEWGKYSFLSGKDTSVYELRKILNLIVGNNPNAAELLWLDDYLHLTPIGERLIGERNNLLSKKAKHTYSG